MAAMGKLGWVSGEMPAQIIVYPKCGFRAAPQRMQSMEFIATALSGIKHLVLAVSLVDAVCIIGAMLVIRVCRHAACGHTP